MAKTVLSKGEGKTKTSKKGAIETAPETKPEIIRVKDETEISIEKKLLALFSLQQNDSKIDRIKIIRGELPLEVEDLEDEVAGLQTRIDNYLVEIQAFEKRISEKQHAIKESQGLIKRYDEQLKNVRNSREFDNLTKEVEFQNLEMQLAEKRIREFSAQLAERKQEVTTAQEELNERKKDLDLKRTELTDIVKETELEEKELKEKSQKLQSVIEERLLTAYKRIRQSARNGLAVVQVQRDACGGCFSSIPPQRQLDIKLHRKIIVCEFCGRILIDHELVEAN